MRLALGEKGRKSILSLETEQEADGRWIAEIRDLPGVLAYGATRSEAIRRAESLALRVLADRLDYGEEIGPRMLARVARQTGLTPGDL